MCCWLSRAIASVGVSGYRSWMDRWMESRVDRCTRLRRFTLILLCSLIRTVSATAHRPPQHITSTTPLHHSTSPPPHPSTTAPHLHHTPPPQHLTSTTSSLLNISSHRFTYRQSQSDTDRRNRRLLGRQAAG